MKVKDARFEDVCKMIVRMDDHQGDFWFDCLICHADEFELPIDGIWHIMNEHMEDEMPEIEEDESFFEEHDPEPYGDSRQYEVDHANDPFGQDEN